MVEATRRRFARPLYLLLVGATFPIGWTMSHILLGVIYYLVLTPIGLLLQLCGHDPMKRRLEPDAQSYWEPHRPPAKVDRYFRLY